MPSHLLLGDGVQMQARPTLSTRSPELDLFLLPPCPTPEATPRSLAPRGPVLLRGPGSPEEAGGSHGALR